MIRSDLYRCTRRSLLAGGLAFGLAPAAEGAGTRFSWEAVQRHAQAAAQRPWRAPVPVPGAEAVGYDTAFALAYRPDRTLPGGIRAFPVSTTARAPVALNILDSGTAHAVAFDPGLFASPGGVRAAGFAGFRAMTADGRSDWMAYLGASYFRAAGSQDQYGLSARGVAIDTGIADREEFPAFTTFWIEPVGTQAVRVYALLDGPSVTGAFRFDSRLTADGVVQDVSAVLHLRRDVARLGIAPATSMFWYGESGHGPDWRPEIHDSDGLAMLTGAGERIWRPLVDPASPTIDSFADAAPRGFGLIQRDRRFADYQDDGVFYDRRPNLWVEPKGDWGRGAVTLYAFPTAGETVDNIAAFWVSAIPARAGEVRRFDYRLRWTSRDPSVGGTAHATDCWRGTAGLPAEVPIPGARKLVIDFVGDALAGLGADSGVEAVAEATGGRLLSSVAYPVSGQAARWRVMADVAPTGLAAALRLYLRRGGGALTETVIVPVG